MKSMYKLTHFAFVLAVVTAGGRLALAGEYTDVIDAFDKDNGDPFDLNIGVGYERVQEKGTITRETVDNWNTLQVGGKYLHQWDYYAKYKFGEYEHAQNLLNLRLNVGLFHDLAFRLVIPIILSDERSLSSKNEDWDTSTPLFSKNFTSPQRSGLDYIAAGLWWAVLDQSRTKEHPTITVFLEGRFGVGDQLTAACAKAGSSATDCQSEAMTGGGGISRNLNELRLGLKFSRRYGVLEPFMGIDGMVGWYKGKDFTMSTGALNDMPPLVGTFDFGMEIIPWEVPELERRFVISVGGGATYISEGRTYTPLFDALGTSEYFKTNADINDDGQTGGSGDAALDEEETAARDAWNGMTDVENYAEFFGRLNLTIQPAKYVKFNLGLKMGHQSEHFITKTDQCPAGKVVNGQCTAYNPGHRPEIDEPGFRFRVEKTFLWSLFLDATAQF